ncbi:hypothetical protein ACH4FX_31635 [Streptomyces sp. NPDC018019]|uniref:hypothetical protein n=1 Tax=Streptomyces sp. NPDC018019 TaxID=3365030 RepID=UPI0037B9930E
MSVDEHPRAHSRGPASATPPAGPRRGAVRLRPATPADGPVAREQRAGAVR